MMRGVQLPQLAYEEAIGLWHASLEAAGCLQPVSGETVALTDAAGRVPLQYLRTLCASPGYRAAAMDGFAVAAARLGSARTDRPVSLNVGLGAVPIDTGGALDDSCDAVVPVEDVSVDGDTVRFFSAIVAGKNVRLPCEDVPPGVAIGRPGWPLRAQECAALIAGGCLTIEVARRPRVAVIPSGNEVVPPGTDKGAGFVVDSNSTMIAAQARALGAEVTVFGIVPDVVERIVETLRRAAADADLVLLLAGSSRGRRDRSHDAIASIGEVAVHGVATRPGKPVVLGRIRKAAVVNLPGYPVAAQVAFSLYAVPLLRRWTGAQQPEADPPEVEENVRLGVGLETDGKADEWRNVALHRDASDELIAVPQPIGGALYRLAQADGVIHLRRGECRWSRFTEVPAALARPGRYLDMPLLIGPYDPLIEEIAALTNFRCSWCSDDEHPDVAGGACDAAGFLGQADAPAAGPDANRMLVGSRIEGIADKRGGQRSTPPGGTPERSEGDPWRRAAAVACGFATDPRCSAYLARRFGLQLFEPHDVPYFVAWSDGAPADWRDMLQRGMQALAGQLEFFGWRCLATPQRDGVPA
ncbi:MAG: molybdopterin molybdotransferase MoeA [Candidatus Eremiobacteraeota bacterium]|nr:molybdopterin molybdotransferase MoeA [Candidatus Eremiobacteraeota bacterium]